MNIKKNTILFVDDEPNILNSLKRVFRKEGYTLLFAGSGEEGLDLLKIHYPGVVVSDQQMPIMTGDEFLKKVKRLTPNTIRILLTGYSDLKSTIKAINEGGVYRYIQKPWSEDDIKLIIRQSVNYLDMQEENKKLTDLTKEQNKRLESLNLSLEEKILERTKEIFDKNIELKNLYSELDNNLSDFVKTFIGILKIYNPLFVTHSKKVAMISILIARKMGLQKESLKNIEIAAMLHDIGMIGIPKQMLDIPYTDLAPDEKNMFRLHPSIGEATLSFMKRFADVAAIIRSHHESFDGNGFPDNLAKYDIPVESRILAVADAYDEINKIGIYKSYPDHQNPTSFIKTNSGILFDPAVVNAFFELLKELQNKMSAEKEVSVSQLKNNMVISRDIVSSNGMFHILKDTALNDSFIERIKTYNRLNQLKDRIYIYPLK